MTTPLIHQVLDRDPLQVRLANNGQARIAQGSDERVMRELQAELETFVCKGQFADALVRILERYLASLEGSRQDAVWVSGFFGSGKSHLLKVLAHLWVDTPFDDGRTARAMVADRLPPRVRDALVELDGRARRTGIRPMAAAGSLLGGSVDHVRLAVLSIVHRACELPEQYAQARFCLRLRDLGVLAEVRGAVEAAGKSWARELDHLLVSPVIADAVLKASPELAGDASELRKLLRKQFPQPRTDITTEQFVSAARNALAPNGGRLPHTVVVLDEVQQYINEAGDRAQIVTEVAEALQTRFDSRVLLVASGQSALAGGHPSLQWLQDRFRIPVQLADAEVETVTREVLLRKKPAAEPSIREVLERHAGEVSRHLQGSKFAVRAEDKSLDVPDYPLLRTRRRFWEECFRTADPAGNASQLRSQLRILHDSLRGIARRPLGAVIPASDLFRALAQDLVASGVLLNEINTRIRQLEAEADGTLKADLCGLTFLIGKLPREKGVDAGIRANAATLADLLVDDVRPNSGKFRRRVEKTLVDLADQGVLMTVDDEYRIQTREGAEWERAFRETRTRLARTEVEIAERRDRLLRDAVREELRSVRLVQGEAKMRRRVTLHFGMDRPGANGKAADILWAWVRDGWSCSRKSVRDDARELGTEDPTLYVHLPKRSAEELRGYVVTAEAARAVLDARGVPSSPEGQEARDGMRSRLEGAEARRDRIVDEIVRAAGVFRGGGAEVDGEGLRAKVESGADASLVRLFPRFRDGDHGRWATALKRIREGTGTPFSVVGWDASTSDHPVAREVLATVNAGERGGTVRKTLTAAPYGWPQDAIDSALLGLLAQGYLRAEDRGRPVGVGELTQQKVPSVRFLPEKARLTIRQRTAVRGLFRRTGLATKSGEESGRAPEFLAMLRSLADGAGGDPPLPPAPEIEFVQALSALSGNEQLLAIFDERDRIERSVERWEAARKTRPVRWDAWELALALRRHAEGEGGDTAGEVGEQLDAIKGQRSLLADPDPVQPCVARLGSELRDSLSELRAHLAEAVEGANGRMAADPAWQKLDDATRSEILRRVGLQPAREVQVASDADLRAELDRHGLAAWRSDVDAVPTRERRALGEAAKLLPDKGTRVRVRRGTLMDPEAVRGWIAEHEEKLRVAVRQGPVILE